MNEHDFEDLVSQALQDLPDDASDVTVKSVSTFEDEGFLTGNLGLVVTMSDGSEFQVTIVQSGGFEEDEEDDET